MPGRNRSDEDQTANIKIVLAIGASAASTQALRHFLRHLALQEDMAAIVVLQHREALDEESLRQALARSGHELMTVKHGAAIEPNKVYLPEANDIVTVENGRFQTRPAEQRPGERGTIDSLLVSLAREEDGKTVAVLFSGTGGDGTLGVAAIKEAGGLTLAEGSEEHGAGELATSNSPAALADFVLPADALAERIVLHAQHFVRLEKEAARRHDEPEIATALTSIATLLRNKTGHDFHGYKKGTFLRRVQRRMQVVQAETIQDYVDHLRAHAEEAQNLFNDLLIGVTQFFRDRKEFELLESQIVPRLFDGKTRNDQFRVWVIGCSTGEEAYSIAILLREHMARLDEVPQVQIFATDLDGRALANARAGRYTNAIEKDMTPERLARWFVKEGDTYCVVKELREMCIFSQHSIVKDAPFSRIDLLSCRNLLIYLDADVQSRVIPLFHFALRPGGFLFLGNSENTSRHTNLFAPIENRSRIFRRLDTGARILPDFPLTAVDRRIVEPAPAVRPRTIEGTLTRRAERIAERYAPAYVITDEASNVLHFSGRMGRYIDPVGGAATLNLLNLVHPDLRLDLRAALTKAGEQNANVEVNNVRMGQNGHFLLVDLVIEPVRDNPSSARNFVVLFKDGATVPDSEEDQNSGVPHQGNEHVRELEADLRLTRERLQTTIEELETTNEELKSSNEEYQSLNEELQSANEELETSKEELQSVNEELTTVNGELAHRVQELGRANSDLKNLLESTQIATIFLDNQLRVTNFTPAVTDIFHLVETDIGRSINHIKSRITYEELQEDARRVLRTLNSVEREIATSTTGRYYIVRVLPYRSIENFIAGVVVTFVDITERRRAEEALRSREERFRLIVESARDYAIFTTDQTGRIDEWFAGAKSVFGWTAEEAIGQNPAMIYTPEDRAGGVWEREFATARETGTAPDMRWHVRKDGSRVFIEGSVWALHDATGRFRGTMKIGQDVTERRRSEEALKASENQAKLLVAELQHRVRNTLAVVRSIAQRTAVSSESVDDYAMHLEGRLAAFARVQAAVTRDPTGGIDLAMLVADELLAHAAHEGEQVESINGPGVRLQPKAAGTIGLAMHELATNSVKYGALSSQNGRIRIEWTVEEAQGVPHIVFQWIETGVKLAGEQPKRRGFGTELLERTLAYELNGDTNLRFEPGGLHCTITLPVDDRILVVEAERYERE
ncbi:CheR family methyltransferase [Microvirga massiliensis]|uniref:CheR family methyltransferase n=1 Tax=Microvirga massiliensis TaxID=1033741 RepID=UPI00062B3136|nr:CheR family methyltransferase [Microvirga massiliensis]